LTEYYKIVVLAKRKDDAKTLEDLNRRYANKFSKGFVSVTVIDEEEAPE
jgi:hypothetical protein